MLWCLKFKEGMFLSSTDIILFVRQAREIYRLFNILYIALGPFLVIFVSAHWKFNRGSEHSVGRLKMATAHGRRDLTFKFAWIIIQIRWFVERTHTFGQQNLMNKLNNVHQGHLTIMWALLCCESLLIIDEINIVGCTIDFNKHWFALFRLQIDREVQIDSNWQCITNCANYKIQFVETYKSNDDN